jgi:glycerophosphoryl diester phosphodiesterase
MADRRSGCAPAVQWQAHRGGGGFERPDNTMDSFIYGWSLGGIAEADVRQTRDGRIVCLHDPTLARTTDAGPDIAHVPVTELDYDQLRSVDAGAKFAPEYAGQRVPLLEDVLAEMAEDAERRMYLDLKDIDLAALAAMIGRFGLQGRIYVAAPNVEECEGLKDRLPGARTLLWCGGSGRDIQEKLRAVAAAGFLRLDQVQLHLNDEKAGGDWRYTVTPTFIAEALKACAERAVDLEVLPWKFERADIHALLDLGVRWYATDEPRRFLDAVASWPVRLQSLPPRARGQSKGRAS